MSSIGFPDPDDSPYGDPEAQAREDAALAEVEDALRVRGLPVPAMGVPEIDPVRLDMEALWRSIPEADREQIGLIGLNLILAGSMACAAEVTAPAASRAYRAAYFAADEELARYEPPASVLAAVRGPSWRIPAGLGPVCRSCGCSDGDACGHGCGWADATQTICTDCADPDPAIPF